MIHTRSVAAGTHPRSAGPGLLITSVEIARGSLVDVRTDHGVIVEIGRDLAQRDERVIEADGAALLPGLHDHHVHLYATASARCSVDCGPGAVSDRAELGRRLQAARPQHGWVRGVGFDEQRLGELDRWALDQLRGDVPVRLQHRSGAMWVVNSAGIEALGLSGEIVDGIERDEAGRPTGRLWRLDGWLRERLTSTGPPDLKDLSQELAAYGVTGVTDATPGYDDSSARALESSMVQRVLVLGAPYGNGPVKVVLPDHQLPSLDDLVAAIADARPRSVALHCVTVASLVLALTALDVGGPRTGDRIEHAAVCPPVLSQRLALMGIQVVTQPSLVLLRGDDYLERVDEIDASSLWPYASLLEAGVGVGCSTDSPYGSLDPWLAIAAATSRLTTSGRVLGATERVSAATALRGFLSSALAPGGPAREVAVGARADLVLLDRPLAAALANPSSEHVRCTMIEGNVVFDSAGVSP